MALLYNNKYGDIDSFRKNILEKLKDETIENKKKDFEKKPSLKSDIDSFFKPEKFETVKGSNKDVGYPQPKGHYRIVWESPTLALEEVYFWFINFYSPNVEKIEKLRDVFSASPQSSFFGSASQKLGLTQDRISQLLRSIGEMSNSSMTMLRELRTVSQTYNFYKSSGKDNNGFCNGSEVTLRNIWATEIEGGSRNPDSVIGLSSQVGFSILPNLFFNTWIDGIKTKDDLKKIDDFVDKIDIGNKIVKTVLKRKLNQYYVWKMTSEPENDRHRKYIITYLKQHLSIIRMYVSWLRPYLYYVRSLQMNYQGLEKPELISSFENALAELEILVIPKMKGKYKSCILITMNYISKPEMSYVTAQDYQNRGPKHVGHIEINLRSYAWSDDQISLYKDFLKKEDEELVSFVDNELYNSLKAVDEFLKNTITETEAELEGKKQDYKKETKNNEKKEDKLVEGPSAIKDFVDFIKDPFAILSNKEKEELQKLSLEQKSAGENADKNAWTAYILFKKTHKMLAW